VETPDDRTAQRPERQVRPTPIWSLAHVAARRATSV
jgi:hypothetical protein